MPPIELTTAGAALLSAGMFATTLAWKLLPQRRAPVRDLATDFALLSNELKHIRNDISELKEELKSVQSKLR